MRGLTVDTINVILLGAVAIFSWFWPFEVFLFSYAVLGPLHYLTEILWLHKKNYFIPTLSRYYWLGFSLLILGMVSLIGRQGFFMSVYASLVCGIFLTALVVQVSSRTLGRLIGCGLVVCLAIALWLSPLLVTLCAVLLPTVIHVFVFTATFMIVGAHKSKSTIGWMAAALFLVVSIGMLCSFFVSEPRTVSEYVRSVYRSFEVTNLTLLSFFPPTLSDARYAVYSSTVGLAVMRFLAFVFTYHYCNWFSKTSIIQWHKASRYELVVVTVVWLSAIFLYAYDYRLGLVTLYFLSLLHVFLEFPLNHWVFIQLSQIFFRKKSVG
jgi:hypothetical protein